MIKLPNSLFLDMHEEKQSFKKNEKLKSRSLIKNLFSSGHIIHHYPFKVLCHLTNSDSLIFPAQIGVSVSKRNFKKAVDRNHIKRKIRESYRKNKQVLYEALKRNDQKLYFFVIYTAKDDLTYQFIDHELKALIQKIISKQNLK